MESNEKEIIAIARLVQQECIRAAREGFQDASMSGLCREGALEAAIGSIQSLDLEKLIEQVRK
ncbi:acetyltransferase [Aliifodinibius sp. S!AR15-10]|uniref:acetyltransferase n=1 Tax=Aliifodinibius sp. S!AR15-10 TaxID=2950437 RepID=UPI002857766E|nr:acetyltransferase [Aliifodinibius sp. S!AR15-10]MDR8393169.1 acetyltransferase [Aliifodinibius sp. S!AR15-10]